MKCRKCGFIASASDTTCPCCGAPLSARTPFLLKLMLICVAAAILFPTLAAGTVLQSTNGTLSTLCVIAIAVFLLRGGKKK